MPLSLDDKLFISNLLDANSDAKVYELNCIKATFVEAYTLLCNQTSAVIREKIADYIAAVIVKKLNQTSHEMKIFFSKSILAREIENDFLIKVNSQIRINENNFPKVIKSKYKIEYVARLKNIFQKNYRHQEEAIRIYNKNIENFEKWGSSVEGKEILNKTDRHYDDTIKKSFMYFLMSFGLLNIVLSAFEYEHPTRESFIISFFSSWIMAELYLINKHVASYLDALSSLNICLASIDDIDNQVENVKNIKKPSNSNSQDYNLIVGKQNNVEKFDCYDFARYTTPKKIKRKKIISLEAAQPITTATNTVIAPDKLPNPGVFNKALSSLPDTFIVRIDPGNLGRNDSFFAIWNQPDIAAAVKDSGDEIAVKQLYDIFQTGVTATKTNTSGIKRLRFGLFEIKKPTISARVIGNLVEAENKSAIVFHTFSKSGFH